MFALDVLKAKHGDCMMLHIGPESDPKYILIDGGPAGVYRKHLRPYLDALAAQKPTQVLPIRMLMISHIDDDHIKGILDLTRQLREAMDDGDPVKYRVQTLWHNSFDDIIGNQPEVLVQIAAAGFQLASTSGGVGGHAKTEHGELLLASVPQGRKLRNEANALGWEVNQPGGHIMASKTNPFVWTLDNCSLQVLGPSVEHIRELQKEWDKVLEKKDLGQPLEPAMLAAFVDRSVFNLASIVVMATCQGRRMLLTGDARGDHVLQGLLEGGLLDGNGEIHVDLLKMPHHGSDHNVAPVFFEKIKADTYVFSGDGKYGNPEPHTLEMLLDAREAGESFELVFTYPPDEFRDHYPLEKLQALLGKALLDGKWVKIKWIPPDQHALRLDLSMPV